MISFTKAFISTILFIGGSFFIPGQAGAGEQNVQAPFNAGEVIERVSHYPNALSRLHLGTTMGRETGLGIRFGETLLDTNVTYVMAPQDQMNPALAFDGTNYLVVWSDQRAWSSDIYAARVRPDGVVIDTAGIAILGIGIYPAVAFDGTNYLAVWEDYRSGPSTDIYGTRISPQGRVLDPNGIAISTALLDQWNPSISFDGGNYLVVWDDRRSGGGEANIYGARVSSSGVVLDTAGIPISLAPSYQTFPRVAYDGANFIAAWMDRRSGSTNDIFGARVSSAGVVLDTAGIAISTAANNQYYPGLGSDGTNTLVTWGDYCNGSSVDLYGARINRSGVVLDSLGFVISGAPSTQWQSRVAFDGTNYLVAWVDARNSPNRDIYGARVTPGAVVLDPNGIPIFALAGNRSSPGVAFDGTNYLVAWAKFPANPDGDIFSVRVTPSGVVLDTSGIAISKAAYWQSDPSVSYGGGNFLTVWEDYRSGSYTQSDIYGTRVSGSGMVLDSMAIPISTLANNQNQPAVAFDGTNWLAVWADLRNGSRSDIYGARIGLGGGLLDTIGIAISSVAEGQAYPSVAFDGTNYLVVWSDYRNGSNSDIYAARVTPGGTVLEPWGIPISTAIESQGGPAVAFDGTNYLIVWYDYRNSSTDSDIYGARVSPDGVVLDTVGFPVSTAVNSQGIPAAAFGGANYLVAWEDRRNGGEERDIYGCRVSPSGVVLDTGGIALCTESGYQGMPAVGYDRGNYLVVWSDTRSGLFYDIYGAKVSPGGAVIDTFAASLQPGNQIYPAIACGPASQWILAYAGFVDTINQRAANTLRIWGKVFLHAPGVESEIPGSGMRPSLRVYPNPFREKAWISANVPGRLKVYDALGRLVREFPKEAAKPGPLAWDGRDERGHRLPGGVYFLRYEHGRGCETRKAVLLR